MAMVHIEPWLVGKPTPPSDFDEFLRRRNDLIKLYGKPPLWLKDPYKYPPPSNWKKLIEERQRRRQIQKTTQLEAGKEYVAKELYDVVPALRGLLGPQGSYKKVKIVDYDGNAGIIQIEVPGKGVVRFPAPRILNVKKREEKRPRVRRVKPTPGKSAGEMRAQRAKTKLQELRVLLQEAESQVKKKPCHLLRRSRWSRRESQT